MVHLPKAEVGSRRCKHFELIEDEHGDEDWNGDAVGLVPSHPPL